ncbi:hypothetical protein NM688_g7347 [Phlebia brevispora]|uniref:Uncharacterized protein n=1 Tax=Phlebia brevispora TaxID=194682 RepID=A0ACC1S6T8_9APHY|nr:hypothetical protein NM688_g7347 [Phlebia brevispora]
MQISTLIKARFAEDMQTPWSVKGCLYGTICAPITALTCTSSSGMLSMLTRMLLDVGAKDVTTSRMQNVHGTRPPRKLLVRCWASYQRRAYDFRRRASEELWKSWMAYYHGTDSRARTNRARSIVWKPKYTSKDMLAISSRRSTGVCKMSASKIPIFFLGATGFLGGSILTRLLARPDASSYDITALVRDPVKAKKLESFGIKTVIGSLTEISQLAEQAHVVFSCADCDNLDHVQHVLAGLKKRHEATGDIPIVIHTSGTGELILGQDTGGMSASDTIFDDSNVEQMKSLPIDAPHRNVTVAYVDADVQGYIKTYIVMPGLIYGTVVSPMVAAGVQNSNTRALEYMISPALDRRQAGVVGAGLSRWGSVHVDDAADLEVLLWNTILSNEQTVKHGWEGFYLVVSDEFAWHEIAKEIGRKMFSLSLSANDEVTAFKDDEIPSWYALFAGSNSRARPTNSISLGWKPKYTTKDFLASLGGEVERRLKHREK